ncbi:DNA-binding response regulator [Lysinibacillus sp. 2017]|uniref:response regulator transcription factor n=1 Tax=unclassified Lysinibacillus TaxID=2636778 RepID=UPI000D529D96|nr:MULTISPECIES: response regulator transcription factor [unclassified Lysinibacillus]AWE07318.1 DNA-binding response regulator [Lysinibacillus sp. 2017]TGN32056.1 response regulator transcription factor [Lysinibacillus sp. S2017]
MKKKILIIEDDQAISQMVSDSLSREDYLVTTVFDGEEALDVLTREQDFDLILLDLMLPKVDGLECLRVIRLNSVVPILIMSAKGDDVDKALGLGMGADDYISKPFSMIELIARIKALIRRTTNYSTEIANKQENIIRVGDLVVDLNGYAVNKNGENLKLTAKEFSILSLLLTKPKQVFTKEQLYNLVWQAEYVQDMNVINVHIRRLREKIEEDPSNPKYIQTLWGIGYRLGEF